MATQNKKLYVDKAIQKAPIWCSTYLSCYSNKDHFVPLPNNAFCVK